MSFESFPTPVEAPTATEHHFIEYDTVEEFDKAMAEAVPVLVMTEEEFNPIIWSDEMIAKYGMKIGQVDEPVVIELDGKRMRMSVTNEDFGCILTEKFEIDRSPYLRSNGWTPSEHVSQH